MKIIAHIESCYGSKFGIPRQAGLSDTPGRVVFEPEYRVAEAVRGLEEFDYVWLLWQFHQSEHDGWSPTVRPPRLGGNKRVGVFATRSPNRPNAIGMSAVKLERIEFEPVLGPVLHVIGADMVDGTPIYDIKPYLPYADSHPEARSGFAPQAAERLLEVVCNDELLKLLPAEARKGMIDTLAHDPRPRYQHDFDRIYTMTYAHHEIKFRVDGERAVVVSITD